MFKIIRFKLSLMEEKFRTRGISTRSEADAKNMKICILLLDRIIKEDYATDFKRSEEMIEQDLDLLFKIMRKQIRAWWD